MLKLNSYTLASWCEEPIYWKRPQCWERVKAGGEGDDRWWDGWVSSLTQWTWVWTNSGRWWRTGKLGVLQSVGSQRHNLGTKQWEETHVVQGACTNIVYRMSCSLASRVLSGPLVTIIFWYPFGSSCCVCSLISYNPGESGGDKTWPLWSPVTSKVFDLEPTLRCPPRWSYFLIPHCRVFFLKSMSRRSISSLCHVCQTFITSFF